MDGEQLPHPLSLDSFRWRSGRSIRPPLELHQRHGVFHSGFTHFVSNFDASPGASSSHPALRNALTGARPPRTGIGQ
jgi:hypothetical protein